MGTEKQMRRARTTQPASRLKKAGGDASRPAGNGLRHLTPIEKTRMYIAENFALALDLDRLAIVAQLSKYHFARQFKAETGFTCMQYLSQVRLSEAAKLIVTTRMRVSEVCYEVGFGDLTHFERQFKRDTGYTPSEYRKRFRLPAMLAEE